MIRQDHRVLLETRFKPYNKATAGRNMLFWCFGPGVITSVQFGLNTKKNLVFLVFQAGLCGTPRVSGDNLSALNPFCTLLHTDVILVFSSQLGFTFLYRLWVELFKTKWLKR